MSDSLGFSIVLFILISFVGSIYGFFKNRSLKKKLKAANELLNAGAAGYEKDVGELRAKVERLESAVSSPVPTLLKKTAPAKSSGINHISGFDDDFIDVVEGFTLEFRYFGSDGLETRQVDVEQQKDGEYLKGWCHSRCEERTFKVSKMEGSIVDFDTGEVFSRSELKEKIRLVNTEHLVYLDDEICFTGFSAATKKELQNLAIGNGFTIRTRVTNNLDYLCKGPSSAPAKIIQAEKVFASVIDETEFRSMCI